MKVNVTCTCGHMIEIEVFGKNSDREWKIKRTESEECPACQLAKRMAAMENDTEWCELSGSEKQVVWAHDIRIEKVKKLEEIAVAAKCTEEFARLEGCLKNEFTEAKFWIDNRYEAPQFFARAARAKMQ